MPIRLTYVKVLKATTYSTHMKSFYNVKM